MHHQGKLVRDGIPEIIQATGETPDVEILDKARLKEELMRKLVEEAKEVESSQKDKNDLIKEIGDVQEVLEAIIENFHLDPTEIAKTKEERKKSRGGFKQGIFLKTVK